MNILKTQTITTTQADTFLVYWTNSSNRLGGVLKVHVRAKIEDKRIAAELFAMQHLLEVKCVLGNKLIGNAGTQLIVSLGAIRKLHRSQSNKAHLAGYAKFLTTRFAGCTLSVDKDTRWFAGVQPETSEELVVNGPMRETLKITGIGEVEITQHVLARYTDRFLSATSPDKAAQAAWKKLNQIASDLSVCEVVRSGLWNAMKYMRNGRQEGRYFLNTKLNLVLVVTDNPREGKRLVTTYPATSQFQALAA
jgi:hypothetical protein